MNVDMPRNHDDANADRQCLLSIVIIGRNEEENIARCIETSIVAANALSEPYEIIYVDSASTDESVAIACKYPDSVIRIEPGEWRCAAAGRSIGTRYAKGKYIAFFDGDMACDPDWIVKGIQHFRESSETVGVVTGSKEYLIGESSKPLRVTQSFLSPTSISRFGGSAIISQNALAASGGFDPYLISNEEEDLSDRILAAGLKIIGLPYKMITHYGPPPSIEETLRRGNYGYHIGLGQYVRRLWMRHQRLKALLKIKVPLVFSVWGISILVLLLSGILNNLWLIVALAISTIPLSCLVFVLRTRDIHKGLNMLYAQFFIIPGLVRSLLKKDPTDAYQPKLTHLQGKKQQ
jgi:glycosyltransferase involved in cell wall biosynthesis